MWMNFSLISEYLTSILSKVDQFFIIRFQFKTSFAENMEQSIVYAAVLALVCSLFLSHILDNRKRKKGINIIDKNRENAKLKSNIDNIQSINVQNVKVTDKQNEITEENRGFQAHAQNSLEASEDKQNIFELDNGFVINKRNTSVNEIIPTEDDDVSLNNEGDEQKKDNISNFLSINNSDAKPNLTKELSEIEATMLEVRQEYKSGKISSTDYLSQTQALYERGENLVQEKVSIGK